MPAALTLALSRCSQFGEAVALESSDETWSYSQWLEDAYLIADRLREARLNADEPVHVHVSNQARDFVAILAVWLAGGVAVPVHRSTPPQVAATLQDRTRARFRIDLSEAPSPEDGIEILSGIAPLPRALLADAALIIFTSGSTGVPKGVVVSHDAFAGKIEKIDSLLRFGPGQSTLLVLNINFSFGLWVSLLTLLRGGRLHLQEKFEPGSFLETLMSHRISRVGMVPTMMRVLFADARYSAALERLDVQASLRQIMIGGESLGLSLAATIRKRFSNTELIDIYGLTETATCDFFAFPLDYAEHPGCIGRPSPGVSFRIMGATGAKIGPGEVGELQIRSPFLMNGYLDAPELTESAYDDGWFKTGDLARIVEGDVVELRGRQKELISRGGNKITPTEIEQAICSHADIAAAMATGVDDSVLGERIHVLLVPRFDAVLDLGAIRRHLETRLEKFKQPDVFYVADALPLGRTGKADRLQMKALIASGDLRALP